MLCRLFLKQKSCLFYKLQFFHKCAQCLAQSGHSMNMCQKMSGCTGAWRLWTQRLWPHWLPVQHWLGLAEVCFLVHWSPKSISRAFLVQSQDLLGGIPISSWCTSLWLLVDLLLHLLSRCNDLQWWNVVMCIFQLCSLSIDLNTNEIFHFISLGFISSSVASCSYLYFGSFRWDSLFVGREKSSEVIQPEWNLIVIILLLLNS